MSTGTILFIVVFAFLMFISPIGIWNRLIKINQEQKAHNREVEKTMKRIKEPLDILTSCQD